MSRARDVCTCCDWAREVDEPTDLPGLFAGHCPACGGSLDLGELSEHARVVGSAE